MCARMAARGLFTLCAAATIGSHASAQQSTDAMVPFSMDHYRGAENPSPVDVSFLLDAPAGKHGFLEVRDGHLATADGKRVRFWGVNITDWSPGSRQIPVKEDAAFWAATLARFGVNCVRFQFLDLPVPRGLIMAGMNTRSLDPGALDREDFFIAELEKRGIYIDFNLLVGRPFLAGDGIADATLLREGAKGTSLFDKRMIELQKEYARQLLTHENAYTHLPYTNDPAIAIVEINNENAINVGAHLPSAFYEQELTGLYNQWLHTHRTPAQMDRLQTLAAAKAGQPVPLIGWRNEKATAAPDRFATEASFFLDLERGYFDEMEGFLKHDLGSKSLIMATADHSHSSAGYPLLLAEQSMDIIDGHTYWQHPEMYVHKLPMVDDPFNSTVVELSRSAVAGKPYTVSEVNNPFPNDYAGEGIPILAAYGSFQDWDGIFWYTFELKISEHPEPYIGDPFDISLDPVKMPELAAGALLFLRDDVTKARNISIRAYTQKETFDSMLLPSTDRPYFTSGFALSTPLQHEVRLTFDAADREGVPPAANATEIGAAGPIASDTRQLVWYGGRGSGLVSVDSARSEALIGHLPTHGQETSHLTANLKNTFCTLSLSSLDGRPIAASGRLLLVAGGRVENTGQLWNSAGTDVTAWGTAPTLIEPVRGTVVLHSLEGARSVTLQPLDGAGQPLGSALKAKRDDQSWIMSLEGPVTSWYEILVVR
jgi:hypothetical protein